MVKIVDGDILTATEDYICHQVNTQGVMGSGVAKAISDKWPIVKQKYIEFCKDCVASEHEKCYLLGGIHTVRISDAQAVLNIFGQRYYGRRKDVVYTDYGALCEAFNTMSQLFPHDSSFAFPYMFGCGLANGDWQIVYGLIEDFFVNHNVTIYRKEM